MAQVTLDQILAQIETLELEELQQLNQAIQRYLADRQETPQRATFYQALLASGLVKQFKQSSHTRQTERRLIQVQDKPVSETIIEERC
ncbi:MAG TPA: hypothetical protein V6C91_19475 [Coleofasciculaceae cyanobacterium]